MSGFLAAFHVLRPWWLLLALAGPAALLLERARRRGAGGWRGVVAPHLLAALLVRDGVPPRLRPATVALLLFPVLAVALAGPSWRREPSPFVADSARLVVALDLSRAAEPALAAGKRKVRDLVAARAGARTGLVAYAGSAHPALPPTDDPRLIEAYLDALSPKVMPRDGDAAGAALEAGLAMLEAGEGGAGTVVLVTPAVPATQAAAFQAAAGQAGPHAIVLLATGQGPFAGAPGATVVAPAPDTADVDQVAALARRNFATAPADDPAMRWRDAGPWVALLAVPMALLFARRGFLAALLLLALGARPAMAAEGDLNWFWQLWLTPDQRAQLMLDRGEPARAAGLFTDPVRRGAALYRAGDFDGAATAFSQGDTAEAAYDLGNAQMMRPRAWAEAIEAYDHALQLRPDFPEARENRDLAAAFLRAWEAASKDRAANQTDQPETHPPDPDQIVVDQPPQPEGERRETQGDTPGQGLSDGEIQALWMRRVGGTPADFLRLRFARQAAAGGTP
ncbi:VWA domain-containing protein [Roseomonas sp. M0104]|uniref:VWA domain-containing protein n=1 Tax=Teichococcus coralli TaxID=2545983 RepID=A0A845B9W4_9PROT|nr:VWA domain-containing protein [Pseudoroseomonas coralli]MXP63565.1 VWA domain-containing protein [Pseudoroseomonas coralli]